MIGGTTAGVNEFVSHAGLVDQFTKEVFCGAIISKALKSFPEGSLILLFF